MPLASPSASVVTRALELGKRISLTYDGKPRIVEVHAVGISTTGKEVFRGYQVEGGSISGETPGWKMMSLGKTKDVKILDNDSLAPREGYSMNDKGMPFIEKQIIT